MFAIINSPNSSYFDFLFVQSRCEAREWIEQKEKRARFIHGDKWREVITESSIVSDREFAYLVGRQLYHQYTDEIYFL